MIAYLAVAVSDIVVNGKIISFEGPNQPIGVMGIYATREDAEAITDNVIEVELGKDPRKEER